MYEGRSESRKSDYRKSRMHKLDKNGQRLLCLYFVCLFCFVLMVVVIAVYTVRLLLVCLAQGSLTR